MNEEIYILWDHSHIWGILALRALLSLGIPCKLTTAKAIAQGILLRKQARLLLIPGGNARLKACALGQMGREAIRSWVAEGGAYLGFCGGAGLALSQKDAGLALCPWERKAYPERLYHLISGHLLATVADKELALPVWWPGRFEPGPEKEIKILARYKEAGADLWIADLPIMEAPLELRSAWQAQEKIETSLALLPEQPLAISGRFGKGSYILSYAHLETPESPDANAWFRQILGDYGYKPKPEAIPTWTNMKAGREPMNQTQASLFSAKNRMAELARLGIKIGLFFQRTPWLLGWRQGAPGIVCNHLIASLDLLTEYPLSENLADATHKAETMIADFSKQAIAFFWNHRLETTLENPDSGAAPSLSEQRDHLFGQPMPGGGKAGEILALLDNIIIANQDNFKPRP